MGRELSPETQVTVGVGITIFLVITIIATLIFARKLETRLIVMGLFLGVASVLYGTMPGPSIGIRSGLDGVGPGGQLSMPNLAVSTSGGQLSMPNLAVTGQTASDSLMKIAFILVLSGIGFAMLARWDGPVMPDSGGKGTHVNP